MAARRRFYSTSATLAVLSSREEWSGGRQEKQTPAVRWRARTRCRDGFSDEEPRAFPASSRNTCCRSGNRNALVNAFQRRLGAVDAELRPRHEAAKSRAVSCVALQRSRRRDVGGRCASVYQRTAINVESDDGVGERGAF